MTHIGNMSSIFIFIGRSGCGKGTQAELLQKTLEDKGERVLYIETGHLFRDFITGESFSQKKSKALYETSVRQPDFLACHMWSHLLLKSYEKGMNVILDGTPRSYAEALVLESAFNFFEFENKYILHLNVSRNWAEERLSARGRLDDTSREKIEKRLNWFDKDVVPAIEYFKNNPSAELVNVNGEQDIESVHSDIMKVIGVYF